MTKARALRNYFKKLYDVDISGMSEVSVWKDFLKKNNNFDSNATSMVGVYTEMTDNEISLGGGGGGPEVILDYTPTENDMTADAVGNDPYYPAIVISNVSIPIEEIETGDLMCIDDQIDVPQFGTAVVIGPSDIEFLFPELNTVEIHDSHAMVLKMGRFELSSREQAVNMVSAYVEYIAQSPPQFTIIKNPMKYLGGSSDGGGSGSSSSGSPLVIMDYMPTSEDMVASYLSTDGLYYPIIRISNMTPQEVIQDNDLLYFMGDEIGPVAANIQGNFGNFMLDDMPVSISFNNMGRTSILIVEGFSSQQEAVDLASSLIPEFESAHIRVLILRGVNIPNYAETIYEGDEGPDVK